MLCINFNSILWIEEEILILNKNTGLATNILNWDAGSELFRSTIRQINKRIFRNKVMGNTEMIRIALHPKDPPSCYILCLIAITLWRYTTRHSKRRYFV